MRWTARKVQRKFYGCQRTWCSLAGEQQKEMSQLFSDSKERFKLVSDGSVDYHSTHCTAGPETLSFFFQTRFVLDTAGIKIIIREEALVRMMSYQPKKSLGSADYFVLTWSFYSRSCWYNSVINVHFYYFFPFLILQFPHCLFLIQSRERRLERIQWCGCSTSVNIRTKEELSSIENGSNSIWKAMIPLKDSGSKEESPCFSA